MSAVVTRRSAVTAAGAVVAGAVIGFVYGRSSDATKPAPAAAGYGSPPETGHQAQPLARLADLPANGGVIKDGVVIVRSGEAVHAFSATCTHLGCTVNKVSGGKIYCPCHGSVFDAQTGAVKQGPANRPLPPVNVSVQNGVVYGG